MRTDPWGIPVVYYHRVDEEPDHYTTISPGALRRHLEALAEGFNFVTISEALLAMSAGEAPGNRIAVTFDDGYECNYRILRPLLNMLGIRVTFFLIAGVLGGTDRWHPRSPGRRHHMTEINVRDLLADGHDIGSHGLTHLPLDMLSDHDVEREISVSVDKLQQTFSRPIEALAYPFGRFTEKVVSAASSSVKIAFSTARSEATDWHSSPYRLRRFFIPSQATEKEVLDLARSETYYQKSSDGSWSKELDSSPQFYGHRSSRDT